MEGVAAGGGDSQKNMTVMEKGGRKVSKTVKEWVR